ncbi:acyl-CoA thioesterase [Arcticibacter eurypsychrophilus]|uniref:acyl-CoA thioesterase n=1 Tax=Arcticibacter eurypsychrophilus TaxID=1434752 RepID=UPI00084DFFC7|nr:thioesterase family protein [Arcticibacter eurypsychrophilus]
MITSETKIRVRYGEVDQMGYMYYGNYAQFYEVARVDMLRTVGMTYRYLEELGIMMPVLDMQCKFFKPAHYDEELTIKTTLAKMPGVRIHFKYEFYNESGEFIHVGETTLVFVDMKRMRPCLPPEIFQNRLKPFFD